MTQGLQGEFGTFWEQTRDRVRAYMFCACSNSSDADDLAQECFLRALRNWSRFEGKGSRQAWLFAIARNTQVDWFRKRKREARLLEPGDAGTHDVPQAGFDDIEMVWETVSGLGTEYREVLHLRFAADLSYVEIAEMLGVTIGTVRSRLHRGVKAVRERIEDRENGT
ncbi:MAG: RNA polymerase sigma factor [Planctomycetota bacterium]|jgi:RNA polymerase sigma-70 factor (ECF subfamily)